MLRLLTLVLTILSFGAFAQSKQELTSTLEMMKKNGLINEKQYQISIKELKKMSEKDYQKLKLQADVVKSDPKIQEQIKLLRQNTKDF